MYISLSAKRTLKKKKKKKKAGPSGRLAQKGAGQPFVDNQSGGRSNPAQQGGPSPSYLWHYSNSTSYTLKLLSFHPVNAPCLDPEQVTRPPLVPEQVTRPLLVPLQHTWAFLSWFSPMFVHLSFYFVVFLFILKSA